jgi:hypothetical protein
VKFWPVGNLSKRCFSGHAAELDVARQLGASLAEKGYDVGKGGPGSGGGAGCEITAHLGIDRQEADAFHFFLMSWQTSSLIGQVFRLARFLPWDQ